jgi:hypothetical protein
MKEDSLVQQCLNLLKKEDIKNELKLVTSSLMDFILYDIKPYIYVVIIFIITIVLINLGILILLFFLLYKQPNTKLNIL